MSWWHLFDDYTIETGIRRKECVHIPWLDWRAQGQKEMLAMESAQRERERFRKMVMSPLILSLSMDLQRLFIPTRPCAHMFSQSFCSCPFRRQPRFKRMLKGSSEESKTRCLLAKSRPYATSGGNSTRTARRTYRMRIISNLYMLRGSQDIGDSHIRTLF